MTVEDPRPEEEPTSFDDIEIAYREALRSIDEAEKQVGSALMELAEDSADESESGETPFTSIGDTLAEDLESAGDDSVTETQGTGTSRISPRTVIEGALFVGGDVALTARRLASLIGKDTDARVAVRLIDELNETYTQENRPYEIQLHEGGFRLALRESFADVQARIFGLGPRDVRLSPEALEVLAFVAYNQPISKKELDEIRQDRPQTILRQLVRLQLVEVQRTGKRRSDVLYRTTARFLRQFGLTSLDDLPQADIFNFK